MFDKILTYFSVYVLLIITLINVVSAVSVCDDSLPKEKADEFAKCDLLRPQMLNGKYYIFYIE